MAKYQKFPNHHWNKLKIRLSDITVPGLDISFNNSPVVKRTQRGGELPMRFFHIKHNREVIWRFPNDSEQSKYDFLYGFWGQDKEHYEYPIHSITKYLDLPKEQLLDYKDKAGLADILKVCDKRIGYNRLKDIELSPAAKKYLMCDLKIK